MFSPPKRKRLTSRDADSIATDGRPETVRYVDAVQDALKTRMTQDERVVIMGQDIAEYGGVFKITEGFLEAFGKARVRNTPIIESGALGAALGLAFEGFRPIVEMQFGDFITCGFNQIVNNLAKDPLSLGCRSTGRHPSSSRRWCWCRPFPLPVPRGVVHTPSRR